MEASGSMFSRCVEKVMSSAYLEYVHLADRANCNNSTSSLAQIRLVIIGELGAPYGKEPSRVVAFAIEAATGWERDKGGFRRRP
jgi:hypothetical protein